MADEFNLAEFTKDGKSVVPEKEETPPTEEKNEATKEVAEEKTQTDESTTDNSQDDKSVEKEENVTLKDDESAEKQTESESAEKTETQEVKEETTKSDYDGDDYSDFETPSLPEGVTEEIVELAKSLDDDYIKKAVQYYSKNKDLRPYLEAYQYNYDDVGDLELLRLKFERENPELSPKAKDRLFKQEVLKKYYLDDPDEHDDEDKDFGKELLKRDASKLRGL